MRRSRTIPYRIIPYLAVLGEAIVVTASLLLAFSLRFDAKIPGSYVRVIWHVLPLFLGMRLASFRLSKLRLRGWMHVGVHDVLQIIATTAVATPLIAVACHYWTFPSVPRSIFILEWIITTSGLGCMHLSARMWMESLARHPRAGTRSAIIYGAGSAGSAVLRELHRNPSLQLRAIGFIDDDLTKSGVRINGVSVLGTGEDLKRLASQLQAEAIIVAVPSANRSQIQQIVSRCRSTNLPIRILPRMVLQNTPSVIPRPIELEDLLGREPLDLDIASIRNIIAGRTVMVTGGGGSIGSELCRQICNCRPQKLVIVDHSEFAVYNIHRELNDSPDRPEIVPIVGNITNEARMEWVFRRYRPELVFHAAAHKHVPLMEANPSEALRNNILGTRVIVALAERYGVDRFVMISSDKAVNPTNVMGATKRATELLVCSRRSNTRFFCVRFGNVMGSTGSVIPLFREQISKGGPVTVTHPDITRYFMTIPEAVALVLQAAVLGKGQEIFVLDMGDPIRIMDLAINLITMSGLVPGQDIQIQITGLRPGEKLYEELSSSVENTLPGRHPKIRTLVGPIPGHHVLDEWMDELDRLTMTNANTNELIELLRKFVPEFCPSTVEAGIAKGAAL